MRIGRIVTFVVVATLLTACGGNGDEEDANSDRATPATPAQDVAADKAAAERAILKLSDFPPGWEAKPHEETPDDPDVARRLSDCLRVDLSGFEDDNPASADSPDFESPEQQEVQSFVGFEPTSAKAQELFAIFERPETPGCLSEATSEIITESLKRPEPGEELPKGVTVGQVSINRASFPTIGERTIAFRMTIPVRADRLQLSVYADMVFALKARAGVVLSFIDFGSPFPTDQAQQLTRIVVDRVPAS
jgi:hypothetical protein